MRSLFAFGRSKSIILVTLLVMLILGALYFFIYIPNNQVEIEAQRYRCLQNVEQNVLAKVENSTALLNQLLVAYKNESGSSTLQKYIHSYSRETFILDSFRVEKKKGKVTDNDSLLVSDVSRQYIRLTLTKGIHSLQLKYTIAQFIESLLPQDVFDQYIVLKDDRIIYQTFASGITKITTDSLPGDKSAFSDSQVKNIVLGGNTYKLFTQQISLGSDSVLTIGGLLSEKKFQHERSKLPENIVLLLLVICITGIISLPWIKLYQMGSQDRLTVSDGLFSFAVSMLLMSLLFFAFFKYNVLLRPGEDSSKSARKRLADQIERAFTSEVETSLGLLNTLDSVREKDKMNYELVNLSKANCRPTIKNIGSDFRAALPHLTRILTRNVQIDLKQVFWLDAKGNQTFSWTADSVNAPSGNYSNREYFSNVREQNLMEINGRRFYLDQLISWTSGRFTTVISGPSKNKDSKVAAMSFNPKTFDSPVLTEGFLYIVTDKSGRVLYHSQPAKDLNEKLTSEFSAADELKATLLAGSESFFKTRYSGKEYRAYTKPFASLPYHLVVLENTAHKNLIDIKIFSFSFMMLLLFFMVLIAELLIVFLFSRQQSFFKKQYFDISWVGPHICFDAEYKHAAAWNILNIVLLIVFYKFSSFLQYLFILLISATSVTLVLNNLYKKHYRKTSRDKYQLKRKSAVALWGMVILINVAACGLLGSGLSFVIVYQLALAFCLALFMVFSKSEFFNNKLFKVRLGWWDYSNSYSFMIFTRLIISSGIPVALFYVSAYNYQYTLMARYRHVEFLQKISHSNSPTFEDGTWVREIKQGLVPDSPSLTPEENITVFLYNLLPSYSAGDLTNTSGFYQPPADRAVSFNGLFRDENVRTSSAHRGKNLIVSSSNLDYRMPVFRHGGFFYWLLFLGALVIFWQVVHRIIRKIFALNLPVDKGWEQIDKCLIENNKLNKLLFIIGAPGSGKLTNIRNKIQDGTIRGRDEEVLVYDEKNSLTNNVLILDMISIPDSADDEEANDSWKKTRQKALEGCYSLVVVNHFEYDIRNPLTNRIKLNFLEDLLQTNKSKVIIISTVHPVNFLDSLNQQELDKDQDKRLPQHDLERWHVLLGHFRIVIDRIDACAESSEHAPFAWQTDVLAETRYTHFLKGIKNEVLDLPARMNLTEAESGQLDGDSLIFKLQVSSHYFYMYIWQSLTKEEKFLLYDMAEDGLVNPYDDYNLTLLISKGLIVRENGILRMFNKGFRNFILTAIGATEALKIKHQIEDNGNWSKLKTPLIIIIGAVFAFLFASQHEAYSTIITYLTVLTAAIPVALRFFSLFEGNSDKAS